MKTAAILKSNRPKILTMAMLLAVLGLCKPVAAAWKKLPDMPVPRWEAGSVVCDGKLYVFGGYKMPTKACTRADVFDPKDNSWTKLKDMPSAVTHMNAVLDGGSVWFAGGFKDGYKGHTISEVWRYDIDKNTYSAGPSLPESRGSGGLAIVGRKLHFIGGLTKDRNTCSPKHWTLDLTKGAKSKWREAKPMTKGRCHFGTVTMDGKIYVIGGMYHHDRGQADLPLVDIYDPKTDSWTKGKNLPVGHTHAEGATFVHQKRIYFMGGMARLGRRRWIDNQITVSTPTGGWKHVASLPRRLSAAAAGVIGDKLYIAGGSLNGARPQPGMWVRTVPSADKPDAPAAPSKAPEPGRQISTVKQVTLRGGRKADVNYLLSFPDNYAGAKKLPLLIFLHGMGERGDNLNLVKKHGPPKLVKDKNATGFIIVSPQCPKTEYWNIEKLSKLLDHILATTRADPKRVYLTGLSMGGFGTWSWAAIQPERFAAAIPICGGGDPRSMGKRLTNVPIWAFHGGKDRTVPLARSQSMVDAIKKAGGKKVKLTVYPNAGHNSWTKTYANPEIYKWLLKHKLKGQ